MRPFRTTLEVIAVTLLMCLWMSCNKTNPVKPVCPSLRIVALSPYGSSVWHPSGGFIGFNYTPLKQIILSYDDKGCLTDVMYEFELDSSGFWLIDADGTDMRRVLPYGLGEPDWSSNGEWIAFEAGAQIYKMRFTGTTFDTTTLNQLTFEGRNFYPAWSPDREWIAYDNTDCGNGIEPRPLNSCGILVMRSDGTERRLVARGRMPAWTPDGRYLIYIGLRSEIFRVSVSDTAQVIRLTSFNQVDPYSRDNRQPKYSSDGTKIAFASQPLNGIPNIWVMNSDGSVPRQLTTEGISGWFDWSPDGTRIVYVRYRATDFIYENGTLWIIDIETGAKRQLTFNYPH